MKRFCVAMLLVAGSSAAVAQEARQVWEEFGKRVEASGKVNALGPDLFGDQVSRSNGALSFSVTDVSLPGNDALPVAFSRTFTVRGRTTFSSSEDCESSYKVRACNAGGCSAWTQPVAPTPGGPGGPGIPQGIAAGTDASGLNEPKGWGDSGPGDVHAVSAPEIGGVHSQGGNE